MKHMESNVTSIEMLSTEWLHYTNWKIKNLFEAAHVLIYTEKSKSYCQEDINYLQKI